MVKINKETKKLLVKIVVAGGLSLAESYLRRKLEDIKEEKIERQLDDIRQEIQNVNVINNTSTLTSKQISSIIRMSEYGLEQAVSDEDGNYSSTTMTSKGIKGTVGNINSDVEPKTYRYSVRLPESSIEVSPDEVKIAGSKITFGQDVKLARYEDVVIDLERRVKELENEMFTPMEPTEGVPCEDMEDLSTALVPLEYQIGREALEAIQTLILDRDLNVSSDLYNYLVGTLKELYDSGVILSVSQTFEMLNAIRYGTDREIEAIKANLIDVNSGK